MYRSYVTCLAFAYRTRVALRLGLLVLELVLLVCIRRRRPRDDEHHKHIGVLSTAWMLVRCLGSRRAWRDVAPSDTMLFTGRSQSDEAQI